MTSLAENPLLAELEAARFDVEISVLAYVKGVDDEHCSAAVVELLRLDVVRDGRRLVAAGKAYRAERNLQGALDRTLGGPASFKAGSLPVTTEALVEVDGAHAVMQALQSPLLEPSTDPVR